MDYFLSEEQRMIKETARELADEKIIPQRAELDEKNEFAAELLRDIAKADLFSVLVPEEYGGPGWTNTQKYIFDFERAAAGAQGLMPFGINMVALSGGRPIQMTLKEVLESFIRFREEVIEPFAEVAQPPR